MTAEQDRLAQSARERDAKRAQQKRREQEQRIEQSSSSPSSSSSSSLPTNQITHGTNPSSSDSAEKWHNGGKLSKHNEVNSSSSSHGTGEHPQDRPYAETGFASLRSHLSTYLGTFANTAAVPSFSGSRVPMPSSTASLNFINKYLGQLASSKLLNTVILLVILLGIWRRRLTRGGTSGKAELSKTWTKVKEKVLETVRMGGSIGYL